MSPVHPAWLIISKRKLLTDVCEYLTFKYSECQVHYVGFPRYQLFVVMVVMHLCVMLLNLANPKNNISPPVLPVPLDRDYSLQFCSLEIMTHVVVELQLGIPWKDH